jgi:hypothetical protein
LLNCGFSICQPAKLEGRISGVAAGFGAGSSAKAVAIKIKGRTKRRILIEWSEGSTD